MALPSIVQTAQGNTTVAAPASVAPSWAASTAGTLLIVVLGSALSGAPTITPPANWVTSTMPFTTNGTAIDLRAFLLLPANNPGGVTTGTWNLTNVNGVAWGMYEIANPLALAPYDDFTDDLNNIGSTTTPAAALYTPLYTNEFWLSACACLSTAAITPVLTGGRLGWTVGPAATSTTGATNVSLALTSQLQGSAPIPATAQFSLSGAVAWACNLFCFLSSSSRQAVLDSSAYYVQY